MCHVTLLHQLHSMLHAAARYLGVVGRIWQRQPQPEHDSLLLSQLVMMKAVAAAAAAAHVQSAGYGHIPNVGPAPQVLAHLRDAESRAMQSHVPCRVTCHTESRAIQSHVPYRVTCHAESRAMQRGAGAWL
jgi:hypothetical protein